MKIAKSQLKQIVQEELDGVLREVDDEFLGPEQTQANIKNLAVTTGPNAWIGLSTREVIDELAKMGIRNWREKWWLKEPYKTNEARIKYRNWWNDRIKKVPPPPEDDPPIKVMAPPDPEAAGAAPEGRPGSVQTTEPRIIPRGLVKALFFRIRTAIQDIKGTEFEWSQYPDYESGGDRDRWLGRWMARYKGSGYTPGAVEKPGVETPFGEVEPSAGPRGETYVRPGRTSDIRQTRIPGGREEQLTTRDSGVAPGDIRLPASRIGPGFAQGMGSAAGRKGLGMVTPTLNQAIASAEGRRQWDVPVRQLGPDYFITPPMAHEVKADLLQGQGRKIRKLVNRGLFDLAIKVAHRYLILLTRGKTFEDIQRGKQTLSNVYGGDEGIRTELGQTGYSDEHISRIQRARDRARTARERNRAEVQARLDAENEAQRTRMRKRFGPFLENTMKITKSKLRQIIKEEIENLSEIKFTKLGYQRDTEPRSLGPLPDRLSGDPDGPSDDAAELRDIADDLETKSPYAAEYEQKRSAKYEIGDQIAELNSRLEELSPDSDMYWKIKREIEDLQHAMIDAGDRGGFN